MNNLHEGCFTVAFYSYSVPEDTPYRVDFIPPLICRQNRAGDNRHLPLGLPGAS